MSEQHIIAEGISDEMIINSTTAIVSAYLGARTDLVTPEVASNIIIQVASALRTVSAPLPPEAPEENLVPAVSIKASVKHDKVTCLECGYSGKMLKRHIQTAHGFTEAEYRERWNLPANHPLTSPEYSERRAVLAKEIGLGRIPNPNRGRKAK